MKLDIKFDFWSVLWILIICLSIIFISIQLTRYTIIVNDYNKYVMENSKQNVEWLFNCDASWQSGWYNCGSMQLRNITGYYCNGTMICKNEYKLKEKSK